MRVVFETDESFSFETLRALGYAVYGGADVGEILTAAQRITPGDGESWYREWRALADRVADTADACASAGHPVSANSAYLRASNYYRTAEFFLRDDPAHDPRVVDTSARAIAAFRSAPDVQRQWRHVRIPYEGVDLDGYYLAVTGGEPGPTLVAHGGFDSTVEEMFFTVGEAARRYGWNCLIFEGPGQGSALRHHGLTFRHDWEAVVTPVVDFALTLPGVEANRLALLGMSMGGYLAPRAAAFEHRLAACIAYDGVISMADAMPTTDAAEMDALIAGRSHAPTSLRWILSNAMWVFGVASGAELLDEVAHYDLTEVASRITCPTLICEAENDQFFEGQPARLYEALDCPKTFLAFTSEEGAGEHCHEGALTSFHQRMFDWLDDTVR
ncbi:alpha/beta fold hydrolase [Mycobacterium sp. NPDC006124]|uniref:alpha/beta hydrolase family protein n=1 Tax=Mycobacterium sp. NPDC006124 TaxID=3156729 RepID=UPI0033A2B6CB